jgi:hypothetical protein
MKYYGQLPVSLGVHEADCKEMLFYQYLPIKLQGQSEPIVEQRLLCFSGLVGACCCDYIGKNGLDAYMHCNVYLTAKHMYQQPGCSFNRPGYHSDGFMTDDINYVWCDNNPTVFNTSIYALTQHHEHSLTEMEQQSMKEMEVVFKDKELLRLDQFNIHKVGDITTPGMRTFFKLSFSKDQYNLIGNSHNYLLDYRWELKHREETRNHPIK